MTINLNCPDCNEVIGLEVEVETGGCQRFAEIQYFAEVVDQNCECDLTPKQIETLEEDAIKEI